MYMHTGLMCGKSILFFQVDFQRKIFLLFQFEHYRVNCKAICDITQGKRLMSLFCFFIIFLFIVGRFCFKCKLRTCSYIIKETL